MGNQTPPVNPPVENPVFQAVVPPPPKSFLSNKLILIVIILIILLGVGDAFLALSSKPKAQPVVQTSPVSTPTPIANTDETASWKTYTNSDYGYALKYPSNIEFSDDNKRSVEFNIKLTGPGGGNFPTFYISVIPSGSQNNTSLQVYNFLSSEVINKFISLPVGGDYSLDTSGYQAYKRLPDILISDKTGAPVENANVSGAGYEKRVFVNKNGEVYEIGMYLRDNLSLFQSMLTTFKFTQ